MTVRPRFLIDENLSPRLAECARARFYEAMPLRDRGLLNTKDWSLLHCIQAEDWTLVTNNVVEFRRRFRRKMLLHAGVVFLEGADAGRDTQIAAFEAALDDIDRDPQLINTELLVQFDGTSFLVSRFDLP